MKTNKFFAVVLLGAMMVPAKSIKADMEQDWKVKLSQAMPFQLPELGLESYLMDALEKRGEAYLYLYTKLLLNKTSNEQLRILTDAKDSINRFTSPYHYYVLSSLIESYNMTYERCSRLIKEIQNSDDQIKKLEEHIDIVTQTIPKFNSSLDKVFIDGVIKQIQEKYKK